MPPKVNRARALIIGVTGQDGAYLSRHLLDRGYEVWGTSRSQQPSLAGLHSLKVTGDQIRVVCLDPLSRQQLDDLLSHFKPAEIYNLSGQSSVGRSFDAPDVTFDSIVDAHHALLQAVSDNSPASRVFYANSGDCFGAIETGRKSRIGDSFYPCSPYAAAKVAAADLSGFYRDRKGLFVCNGFLFNHESPLRNEMFVTRKIIDYVIQTGPDTSAKLQLGNIEVFRDWGFAGDYVDAMSRTLQLDAPEDFVIASGRSHSLASFVQKAFETKGLNWRDYTVTSDAFLRKSDIYYSCGDPDKAQRRLGWTASTTFEQLVCLLVRSRSDAGSDR